MADVINPAYLSMPAQVQKNKDDIEALRNSAFVAKPAGQYSAATTYGKGALVAYTDGNTYYHFSDTETQGVPPTDTANWVIYQEGIPGPQGIQGSPGAPGNDGKDGVTPNITATATVSNTTGTPSVNVSKGGTAENPSFAFAFQNIKGETGAQGEPGEAGQGFNYTGAWVSGGEYHPYDIATYNGTAYNCTVPINDSTTTPDQDTGHWEVFARGGQAVANYITLTGTSGTLTEEQFAILQENPLNYIILNGYRYNYQYSDPLTNTTKMYTAAATQAGAGTTQINTILITTSVSAKHWTLSEFKNFKAYLHNINIYVDNELEACIRYIDNSNEAISRNTFLNRIRSKYYNRSILATGICYSGDNQGFIYEFLPGSTGNVGTFGITKINNGSAGVAQQDVAFDLGTVTVADNVYNIN